MKNQLGSDKMTRMVYDIPDDVVQALTGGGLWDRYRARPPYQQNDYIGWITRGKRQETRQKRLKQMLDELRAGDAYMGIPIVPRKIKETQDKRQFISGRFVMDHTFRVRTLQLCDY